MSNIKNAFAISLAFISCMSYPTPVLAQLNAVVSNSSQKIAIRFKEKEEDGSDRGRPGGREGTASRGECPQEDVTLTALVPTTNSGLAVEESPTFWFYVPYKPDETPSGEFSLQDEQNNDIYRTSFTLPLGSGIVSLKLPPAAPLEMNKKYHWYFKLYCTGQTSSNPVFVHGWVQRVALKPDIESLLKAASTPRERIAIYAREGIWYTAITELVKLRISEPQNASLDRDWATLLRDVGLENLARERILGSVTTNFPLERREPKNTGFRNYPREQVGRDEALQL